MDGRRRGLGELDHGICVAYSIGPFGLLGVTLVCFRSRPVRIEAASKRRSAILSLNRTEAFLKEALQYNDGTDSSILYVTIWT